MKRSLRPALHTCDILGARNLALYERVCKCMKFADPVERDRLEIH
ncbi:hypothetical protein [Maricaulis virginensis]|nr:hypothetical protein [Maricaulis virginensis]